MNKLRLTICTLTRHGTWLFHFTFHGLPVRCIFFGVNDTILLGVQGCDAAWQISIPPRGIAKSWIPNESFKSLPARLKSATDARIATKFYEAMARALRRQLRAGTHECPDNAEIARLIGRCRTTSTRYGPDGTKPFFHHWRRANPSTQNLNKIGDHFGHAIRVACRQQKVTAVWSESARENALLFLEPERAFAEIRQKTLAE